MRKHIVLPVVCSLLVIPALAVAGGPQLTLAGALSSLAGDFGATAAWSGIWTQDIALYDCASETPYFSTTNTDTTCIGDPFYTPESAGTMICAGTVTDTNINVDCSWSIEEPAGCVVNTTLSLVGTRSGETSQLTATVDATYVGDTCEYVGDICMRSVITGTRIGPAPPTCNSPVETATWGRVKALYR